MLEPNERIAEVLFGLIMVLTCTGSLSVADAGRDAVRTMLIAGGLQLAWGIIDGLLYLMGCLNEQARGIRVARLAKSRRPARGEPHHCRRTAADVAAALGPAEYESIRLKLPPLPEPPSRPDWARNSGSELWRCACG